MAGSQKRSEQLRCLIGGHRAVGALGLRAEATARFPPRLRVLRGSGLLDPEPHLQITEIEYPRGGIGHKLPPNLLQPAPPDLGDTSRRATPRDAWRSPSRCARWLSRAPSPSGVHRRSAPGGYASASRRRSPGAGGRERGEGPEEGAADPFLAPAAGNQQASHSHDPKRAHLQRRCDLYLHLQSEKEEGANGQSGGQWSDNQRSELVFQGTAQGTLKRGLTLTVIATPLRRRSSAPSATWPTARS